MLSLKQILSDNKQTILREWFDRTAATYPADTEKFIKKRKNKFANPIGHSMDDALDPLFAWAMGDQDVNDPTLTPVLERIMKVRAIQEFSPAQGVGFIIFLKDIAREKLKNANYVCKDIGEVLAFESRVDDLLLLAFNVYVQCKEKIFEMRANELKAATSKLVERACRVWDRKNKDKNGNGQNANPNSEEVTEDETN